MIYYLNIEIELDCLIDLCWINIYKKEGCWCNKKNELNKLFIL